MKKFIYCALLALIAISCEKIEEPWENPEEDSWIDIPVVIPRTLSAYSPEFGSQGSDSKTRGLSEYLPESWDESEMSHTRTYAVINPSDTSEYIQYWSEGDAISLFLTTMNLQYQKVSYMDGTLDIGKFEIVGDEAKGTSLQTNYYYSVYPYKESTQILPNGLIKYTFPATQHYNGDSYANGENGLIATILKSEWKEDEDNVLYFKNFCSYLQLRLTADEGESKKVRKITLVANNQTDKIAGVGGVIIRNDEPTVTMMSNTTNKITLDCGDGVELSQDPNKPSKFWFVLPGGFTFTQGFSVTIIFDDNSYYKKSTSKVIGIERSHIKPMGAFEPISVQPTGPIRYRYHDTNIKEPYPLNNTFMGEDGMPLDIIDQIFDEETKEWVVLLSGPLHTIGSNSFVNPQDASGEFDTSYPDISSITIDCDNEVSLADFAFFNCTSDTITINDSVGTIGEKVLMGSNVNTVTFLGDVETIKANAFLGHTPLTSINLNNVKEIENSAFYGCTGLTEVQFDKLEVLGAGVFQMCTSLQGVLVLPATLKEIGEGIFTNTRITSVYCYAVTPPQCNHDNNGDAYIFPASVTIYVPAGSEWDYMMADGWWSYYISPMQ